MAEETDGNGKISVLMETEGTYPYVGGGVSTWCHILCRELRDVEYHIYAITGDPSVTYKYDLPGTVKDVIHIPLWGTEEPAEYVLPDVPFSDIYMRKQDTTEDIIEEKFIPLFEHILSGLTQDSSEVSPISEAAPFGETIYKMYKYFQKYDYNTTFKSRMVWEMYEKTMRRPYEENPDRFTEAEFPSVYDLTVTMRWFYNLLMPLNAPIPKVDVTHSTIAGFAGIASIVAKFEYGTPFILTEHGVFIRERYIGVSQTELSPFQKRFLITLSILVSRVNYAYADQVSPVAYFNWRWEEVYGVSQDRLKVIYNAVSAPLTAKESGFMPGPTPHEMGKPPTVVALARIFPLKDVLTMIRTAEIVRYNIPDVRFKVYGDKDADPPYVQKCEDLIQELNLDINFLVILGMADIQNCEAEKQAAHKNQLEADPEFVVRHAKDVIKYMPPEQRRELYRSLKDDEAFIQRCREVNRALERKKAEEVRNLLKDTWSGLRDDALSALGATRVHEARRAREAITDGKDVLESLRRVRVRIEELESPSEADQQALRAVKRLIDFEQNMVAVPVEDEEGVAPNFKLAGFHSEPTRAYDEGDISILTSISEGFPYTVLESMACERPVVATDVGGVREALTGFGVICKPRDPQDLANGVIKLLEDHELRLSLGRKARQEVLSKYRLDIFLKAYMQTYRDWAGKTIHPAGYPRDDVV